ncbi:MAG: insulinase family protein [Proteobacteria bacterium]|nr:insulinase family protein [Pseudomonadota bacterium]
MRKNRNSLFILLFVVFTSACATGKVEAPSALYDRPEKINSPLLSFELPKVETWELSNGLKVVYLFDNELPIVKGSLFLPGGSLYEDLADRGVSQALGSILRNGGVKGYRPEELDKKLDNMAAHIESAYGDEYGSINFSSLSEDFPELFSLVTKVIFEPSFDEQRLGLWKTHALESIRRRKDSPEVMGTMAFAKLIYGNNTPFSESPTVGTINKINKNLILKYYRNFVRPNGAWLIISGAIEKEKAKKMVEEKFSSWQQNQTPLAALPKLDFVAKPGVYVLNRDFEQSFVLMGHEGPPRLTPDIYQMSIYNRILGTGGFGSLLFDQIRTKLGLAYDVNGGLAPGIVKGSLVLNMGTRNEEVAKAVNKAIEILKDTIKNVPSESNFTDAKSSVQNSFVFKFDDKDIVQQRYVLQRLQGYPLEYDSTYLEKINLVTPDMVREVGKRWVKPESLITVIVGKVNPQEIAKEFPGISVYTLDFDTEPKILNKVQ